MAEPGPEPKTAGIPPAQGGPLKALQFAEARQEPFLREAVCAGAREVSKQQALNLSQTGRIGALGAALENFLVGITMCCPPGSERSTAISRAREAKMWAEAAIELEGR